MMKQITALVIASLIVLLLSPYLATGLHWLQSFNSNMYGLSKTVFSNGAIGIVLRQLVSLLILPILLASIPALIYYAVYRQAMPYYHYYIWVLWIILATVTLLK